MYPDPAGPTDLRDLDYGEHMLLWTVRAVVTGRGDSPTVRREFEQGCGALATEARNALGVFVQQLAARGRRSICLAPPGCLSITRDEQLFLATFAAAQADDQGRFSAHFRWLAATPSTPPFFAAARVFTIALARRGYHLRALPPRGQMAEPQDNEAEARGPLRVVA